MSKARPSRERVLLVLEDEAGAIVPFTVRLRKFLKAAHRAYALRCVWVQDAGEWTFGDELHQGIALDIEASQEGLPKVG